MKPKIITIFIFFVSLTSAAAQVSMDLEGGYIFAIPYNVVRIPSTGGTKFDLAKDFDVTTAFAFRARINFVIGKRHVVSALYAPLTVRSKGELDKTLVYDDETFPANTPLKTIYKFNSYRLTYRYILVNRENFQFGLGLTGKVRDANITVESSNAKADYPNLGFVPLINFYLTYAPLDKLTLLLEGDALGTGKGRAEDIFAGATFALNEQMRVKAGYRILEGGADVERNYNFSFFNYAVAGIIINLKKHKN